jgi:membrane protease YdiL (CAAX protease family)
MRKPFPGVWFSVLLVAVMMAGQWGLGRLFSGLLAASPLLGTALVNLLSIGLVCGGGYVLAGRAPTLGKGRPARWGLIVALPVAAAGAAVVLSWIASLLSRVFPLPPGVEDLLRNQLADKPAEAVLVVAVVAPLTEELLFRGLILRGLEQRYGAWPALLVSSALFAASHVFPAQAIPAFAAGLYLGWLYLATGTLWWPLAAHALYNGLVVTLAVSGSGSVPGATPWWLTVSAMAALALGLFLTQKWAPLSPPKDSDTVAP